MERKDKMKVSTVTKVEDFDEVMQLTRLLLLPFGIWPLKYSKTYHRILRPILIIISLSLMLFMAIPLILFMFIVIKDIKIRIRLLGPIGFTVMSFFKYVIVIIRRQKIADCMEIMIDDWRNVKNDINRNIMFEYANIGKIWTVVSMILMYVGGMPYITIVPLTKSATVIGNVTLKHLAYPAYFHYFNPRISPIYEVVLFIQFLCGLTRYTITSGIYSIIILSIMHITSQIAITSSMLRDLADNYDQKSLGTIVSQHLHLLKFAKQLESIFNEVCLVEVLGSNILICFLGYFSITEYEKKDALGIIIYFFSLMSFVFNIFILCYMGQHLHEQCESIGIAAYATQWYNLSDKEAKNIIFLVSSSQRPVVLTAGNMMTLSLQSFTSVMKASASYLSLLRQVIASET